MVGAPDKPRFEIDPDIRTASSLPPEVSRDPQWFRRIADDVLASAWHLYPDVDIPTVPESVRPWSLLPGALDEPLLWTRDAEDQLRLLSNVCTHRAFVLIDRPGTMPTVRCKYHGRRFGLDGQMHKAPCFEHVEGFPGPRDHLAPASFDALGPLHFAALDPAVSFADLVGPLRERLGFLPWDLAQVDPVACRDYTIEAPWILYCDNYLEGLHIPYVHPTLARALDFSAYETHLLPYGVLQLGLSTDDDEHVFRAPAGHPDHGRPIAGYYYWLFPTTMINAYPWGLSVNAVLPVSPRRTRIVYLTYVWDASKRERGAGAGLDEVEHEDDVAVERTARGIRARLYGRGRYSATHERGVHHFHRLLAARLAEAGG
jgi:choline monooxygenase